MRIKSAVVLGIGAVTLAACEGFKEAMSAHQDVVARAGTQELSATRLGDLLGQSQFQVTKEIARSVAELWVNYQLLGQAAARGDSLNDAKVLDEALWPIVAQAKIQKWGQQVSSQFESPAEAAQAEQRYNQGEVLAARHILFTVPPGSNPATKDSIRRKAEQIRAQATASNFAQLATEYSEDGSKSQGGALGVFQKGQMVPEFERGLLAIQPGQVSPVVESQFGYHIIYRQPFSEVKDPVSQAVGGRARQAAESTYFAKLEQGSKLTLKSNAPTTAKAVAKDMRAHRKDEAVIATTAKGDFTAADLSRWLETIPADANIPQQLSQAPDSLVRQFLTQMIVRGDLFLKQADSAKVTLDPAETNRLKDGYRNLVNASWAGLGVEPKALADSGKTPAERERIAAARIDGYLGRLFTNSAQFVSVPGPLESVLHSKYPNSQVNDAGIDRAVQRASVVRAKADSTRAANQPRSAVPLPGQPAPGGAAPTPAAPPAGKAPAEKAAPAPKP